MDVGSGCGDGSRPSRSVCWYRLNERGSGSDGEGQDGCDDQVEKTKDVGSNCQSHRMTIDPSKAFRLKTQHDVWASVAAHEYVGGTSDTDGDEKPQHMERAGGGAHDARLQPSVTAEPARLGGVQGGIVVPFCVGHPVHVHGMVSRGVTADTPKKARCASLCLHVSRCGKQENDCSTPSLTASSSEAGVTEALSVLE